MFFETIAKFDTFQFFVGYLQGILGIARAWLVGYLGRKMLSQAQSSKVKA